MIVFKEGNLFNAQISLAHCISYDCKMSRGIAKEFKNRFGGVQLIKQQGAKVGEVAILHNGNRFIYCLVTKWLHFHKPTINSVSKALMEMRKHMLTHNIKQVAIPKIATGLDRLPWWKVEKALKMIFNDDLITVFVYTL